MRLEHISISAVFHIPVDLPTIKCDVVLQVFASKNKPEEVEQDGEYNVDIDLSDYENIQYMGMKIEGYNGFSKLKSHLNEMGIDICKIINDESQKHYSKETIQDFLDKQLKTL
jgi:hypothetical protein